MHPPKPQRILPLEMGSTNHSWLPSPPPPISSIVSFGPLLERLFRLHPGLGVFADREFSLYMHKVRTIRKMMNGGSTNARRNNPAKRDPKK